GRIGRHGHESLGEGGDERCHTFNARRHIFIIVLAQPPSPSRFTRHATYREDTSAHPVPLTRDTKARQPIAGGPSCTSYCAAFNNNTHDVRPTSDVAPLRDVVTRVSTSLVTHCARLSHNVTRQSNCAATERVQTYRTMNVCDVSRAPLRLREDVDSTRACSCSRRDRVPILTLTFLPLRADSCEGREARVVSFSLG
ncbi:MAG: hypothetical protein JWM95_1783, partial [Gemmatimonadetes bacterium]|nr:hypothetical protein [Gemmatimonadota bacterium]